MTGLESSHVHDLLADLLGDRLVRRGAPGFEDLVAVVYAGEDRTPALVAQPRDVAEVSAVVRAAATTGIPFAVRGRGHSFARYGLVADGLVLDLRLMNDAAIDADTRIGTAHASTSTGSYTIAAAAHGLATGFGDNPDVGIPGLVLGGGIGYLSRRDGLTIDNLVDAEVVLADGSVVVASEDENPDLFWALRGGGGNFGVVTALRMRLQETPAITGGVLAFEPRPATATALAQAARDAPDEVSLMINVTKAPPWPFLPTERHGTPVVTAIMCHSGSPEAAEADLVPFRAAGDLIADQVHRQPYPNLFDLASEQNGTRTIRRTSFIEEFTEQQAEDALELVAAAPTSVAIVNLRTMGGAIARIASDSTAFAYRDRAILATIRAIDRDPVRADAGIEWAGQIADTIGIRGAAKVTFLGETVGDETFEAYPEATLRRLQTVKAAYDPGNLFRSNYNIAPATLDHSARPSGNPPGEPDQ